MTTDTMTAKLLEAANQTLRQSKGGYQDILELAEVANLLQSQQLAGDLLGRIGGRIKGDDAINGRLPAEEVLALTKAYKLLARYDPSMPLIATY